MVKIYIQAVTQMGSCMYKEIEISEDYTMNELVKLLKEKGFIQFRLVNTMKKFVTI